MRLLLGTPAPQHWDLTLQNQGKTLYISLNRFVLAMASISSTYPASADWAHRSFSFVFQKLAALNCCLPAVPAPVLPKEEHSQS
jgi:hypothetical protein